jgi:hypothetical protein
MLPDVLQALKNPGLSPGDFQAMFSSARKAISEWVSRRAAGYTRRTSI